MADSDDGFVSRWSRRKAEAKPPAQKGAVEAPGPEGGLQALPGQAKAEPTVEIDPAELPDPETLTADSDFTVFLEDGVPEALRRRALRRLWRLNPVLANLDGLNDYDDDFTDAATVVAGLKTLYKVGRGFLTEEEEAADKAAESAEMGKPDSDPVGIADTPSDQDDKISEHGLTEEEGNASQTLAEEHGGGSRVSPAAPTSSMRQAAKIDDGPLKTGAKTPANARRNASSRRWGDRNA